MKKEKNIKKESKLKKKVNELKKTTRGLAILKLIRWTIFFFAIFVFCLIASLINNESRNNSSLTKEEQQDKEYDKKTAEQTKLQDLISLLSTGNYEYQFEVNVLNNKTILNGMKTQEENMGYKEDNSGIIKYLIDNTGIYQITNVEKIPIEDFYNNLEEKYLNMNILSNNLKQLSFIRINEDYSNPEYEATSDRVNYNITYSGSLNEENVFIKEIEIKSDDYSYILTFKNMEKK